MNYKLTEPEAQSEAPKKLPYNLREKREKDAAYRTMIRAELADELYQKIVDIVIVNKKYKDPNFSSKDLAKLLQTNTRYLSAVVNSRFGMNYSCLLNEYRVKDALRLLADKKNAEKLTSLSQKNPILGKNDLIILLVMVTVCSIFSFFPPFRKK